MPEESSEQAGFEIGEISEELAATVGRLAISHANLDQFITATIWRLSGLSHVDGDNLTGEMSFAQKIAVLQRLVEARGHSEHRHLFDDLERFNRDRNEYVHAPWQRPVIIIGDDERKALQHPEVIPGRFERRRGRQPERQVSIETLREAAIVGARLQQRVSELLLLLTPDSERPAMQLFMIRAWLRAWDSLLDR